MTESSAPPRPRTPGAKRAAPGEYVFDLARVNHILGSRLFDRKRLLRRG
jgi:hypothetical protein